LPEVIDELSYSSGDNGQVPNRQTHTGHGNGQYGQMDSLYAREEGNLSDNGFHLSNCPNIEFFNGLDLDKRLDILISMDWSSGDNGQVPNRQTHTGRGNEQVVQVDSLYAREEGNLSDNGFHLFTCSDVETFNGLDLDKRLDILVRQYWSAGAYRQDLSFEEFALGETGYLSTLSGNELSDQFSENLDLLKSMGKIEIS